MIESGLDDPRERRRQFLSLAQEFVPYLVAEQGGLFFILPTDDHSLSKLFVAGKKHEEGVLLRRALKRLAEAGVPVERSTFLDIGASVGTTAFAALASGFQRVVSCEPVSRTFRLLQANLALNGEDRVSAVEAAISNTNGVLPINVEGGARKARVLVGSDDQHSNHDRVRTVRLDDLAAEGLFDPAEVGFVLMDVEGHEAHALAGGSSIFGRGVPFVFEMHPKALRLGGRIDDLEPLLANSYTHLLDLHDHDGEFEPVNRLQALIERYPSKTTDILAARLPGA